MFGWGLEAHTAEVFVDHVTEWLDSDVKVIYRAWVIMIKLCVDKLEDVRVLAGLHVDAQTIVHWVRSCKRPSILINHTRCKQ